MLQSLGCSTESNPKELSKALRQATVSEWLGENSLHYQSFLTHDQLHEEAQKFIEDGHYSGDMGDPVLVNVLSLPTTIYLHQQKHARCDATANIFCCDCQYS